MTNVAADDLPGAAAARDGGREIPSDAAAVRHAHPPRSLRAMPDVHLSPLDAANLLAGHAVACVTGYLDGSRDAARLAVDVASLEAQSLGCTDPVATWLMQGVRMILVAARGIIDAERIGGDGEALIRRGKWRLIAAGLVELIEFDSRMLIQHAADERRAALSRELDELASQNAAAAEWGAAAGGRGERMAAIRRELHGDEPRG
ncbi:hypothetical protein ACRAVF_34005 (plasmid) [Bradyrhizobium oligotrophicum S58]